MRERKRCEEEERSLVSWMIIIIRTHLSGLCASIPIVFSFFLPSLFSFSFSRQTRYEISDIISSREKKAMKLRASRGWTHHLEPPKRQPDKVGTHASHGSTSLWVPSSQLNPTAHTHRNTQSIRSDGV